MSYCQSDASRAAGGHSVGLSEAAKGPASPDNWERAVMPAPDYRFRGSSQFRSRGYMGQQNGTTPAHPKGVRFASRNLPFLRRKQSSASSPKPEQNRIVSKAKYLQPSRRIIVVDVQDPIRKVFP